MKKFYFLLIACFAMVTVGIAQNGTAPVEVITGTFMGQTQPLRDLPVMDNDFSEVKTLRVVTERYNTTPEENTTSTVIPNLQTDNGGIESLPLDQNFIGASSSESGAFPPDPTGAVGPNHYVHSVNSLVKIFDKTGNLLVGPVSLGSFLGFGGNGGDPIVLYDQLADRWVVSEFGNISGGNSLAIGVSVTNDPGGAYNLWQFTFSGFPDYPKYGVWHDGYYGTVNLNGQTTRAFAMERDVMLAGGANPQIAIFSLPQVVVNPNQVKSPVSANLVGTTFPANVPGYIVYLQDDAWGGVSFDHLKVWEIDMDWGNIGNSTISNPLEIPTDPFDAGELFGNGNGALFQPGTNQRLAAHGGIISFSANYRDFGTYNSWLITFNTFIDNNLTGGIRWIELRNDATNPWSIFQEGTFSIADGHSRVMSSAAMDAAGNIAMGYTTGSTTLAPSLRYTGRFDGDPLGTMTVAEDIIIDGPGVRTNSNRYGDYAHMTMDPNNFTFWFTSDYFSSNNQWRTQIASFNLTGGFNNDVGVNNIIQPTDGILTNAESVEVSIRNFGLVAQSNIPLELRVDGNLIATESFAGPLNPNDTDTYTFAQTVDLSTVGQTYEIEVSTNLAGDQFAANDSFTKNVTHLFANDVGISEITAPTSGNGLGSTEVVSVTVRNYGAATQSNFDVQYDIDGGTPVVETFAGPILSGEEITYDFTQTADFSALGTYTLTASTELASDQQASNDEASTVIEKLFCQPNLDCSFGDGFQLVSIAEINNPSGCEGYGDFRSQVANLGAGGSYDLTITTGYGDQHITVWIDFNDNFSFEANERVVLNHTIAPGQGAGTYTETIPLNVPAGAALGSHIMRMKSNWDAVVPTDACEVTTYGETEDYTANITVLGVEDQSFNNSDLLIVSAGDNLWDVTFRSNYDENVFFTMFNALGQEMGSKMASKGNDGTYKLKLDLTSAASGVYLLRVGGTNTTAVKTGRVIVK
ncbi:GEVED domain-containing protein [Constantimarinum furrinae]|uniref:GEVED domain-containing protein n=1 Tax=Constantimarinum furrinae TaxID=2562285 RepID=A0A7G8PVX7_9FLAO|nr:GEVED domain-containing protein [Constantimarinum furrinae]QNJ98493.1 hypothetical protein ALE3EI_1946 [Constantimarinum furrinae]